MRRPIVSCSAKWNSSNPGEDIKRCCFDGKQIRKTFEKAVVFGKVYASHNVQYISQNKTTKICEGEWLAAE